MDGSVLQPLRTRRSPEEPTESLIMRNLVVKMLLVQMPWFTSAGSAALRHTHSHTFSSLCPFYCSPSCLHALARPRAATSVSVVTHIFHQIKVPLGAADLRP